MATRRVPRIRTRQLHEADDDLGYVGSLLVEGYRVYACGGSYNSPTLLVSDDGARSFRKLPHPRTTGLRSISREDGALYLVGEYGLLAVSVDHGLTWTHLDVDISTCLFHLHRDPDRGWWIIGDDGVILRSTDGVTYRQLPNDDWETRLLYITNLDGAVHILGYDGAIKRWNGRELESIGLADNDAAMTALIETRAGAWIAIGDGGMVFRSEDKGASFETIELDSAADLEAIIELPQGLLICGDDGLLLFSDDDGRSFWPVPNDLDGHLWSLAVVADRLIVGGDEGAIWSIELSPTETVETSDDFDDEENDDEGDADDDDDADVEQVQFASIEEASARWIREGKVYAEALNGYVSRIYDVGPNKAGSEPIETRKDMAAYVLEQLATLNAAGQHRRARTLFPPAYEPFEYGGLGQQIDQVAYLGDGRIVARTGGSVYELERDRIVPIADVFAFAQSRDRRWVAKCREDGVDVHDGWDGPRVRRFPHVLPDLASATLTPEGDAMLAACETGIFWVTEQSSRKLLPEGDDDSVDYPHAAMSPNGRFVSIGTKDTSHVIIDRKTGRRFGFEPAASYPCFTYFHADRPDVLLSSCHALYGSATRAVDLEALVGERKEPSRVIDRRAWVYSVGSAPFGYLLGDNSGYIWALDFEGTQQWYAFLGATQTAIDVSPDGKRLLAGSYAGIVVELDLAAPSGDPRLLTNGPVYDLARWVFWLGREPMIW